jgi:signal transduction histidine kinase
LVVPLVLASFFNLWSAWKENRALLNDSIEQQANLAATAFEQWVKSQQQTLITISDLAQTDPNNAALKDYLDSIVKTRPNWLDVQIVNKNGEIVLTQSTKKWNLQTTSVETLKKEIEVKKSLVIVTEQINDEKLRLLSLAMPLPNDNFVVARIDGTSASDVFDQLELPKGYIIAVFDGNGQRLYRSRISPEQLSLDVSQTPLLTALVGKPSTVIEIESPYDKIRRVYGLSRVESANCMVAVGVPSATLYEPAKEQFTRQLLLSLLIAVLAVFTAFLIARSIVEPMRILTGAARAFGEGDLTARTEIEKNGTIRELGLTFNQMAEQIATRENKLKELDLLKSEFVSNVSHELRTPLTTIKTIARLLQRNNVKPAEREDYLETIAAECDRQMEFVQNLLDLSRIESGAYRTILVKTDVVQVLNNSVKTQQSAAKTQGVEIRIVLPEEPLPPVITDETALHRIISGLLENAVKYSSEGGTIEIKAKPSDDRLAIEISDDGFGIAPEDLPRIFEKFYRGQPLPLSGSPAAVESLNTGKDYLTFNERSGVGLGLYLVKNLIEQIGARIGVESPVSETGKGSKFTVLLPVYQNPD